MKPAPWLASLACAALGGLLPFAGQAADKPSPEVVRALQVLAHSEQQGQRVATPARQQHVLSAGQTLDIVIRQHFPASPLRVEVLREVFVKANPKAFPHGKAGRLPIGSVLEVPTRDEVMNHAFGTSPPTLPIAADGPSPQGVSASASTTASGGTEPRRWVRYP